MNEKSVLMKGSEVEHTNRIYTITRVHSIEDECVIYEVDGPGRRLLVDSEITPVDLAVDYTRVIDIWHYALDFHFCEVAEYKAFGIVFGNKIAVYSPDFKGYFTEENLKRAKVNKSFNLFTKERNFEKAKEDIYKAVNERYEFYKSKAETYSTLIEHLE